MQRTLVVEFTKMNGAGNDFVVVDNRFYHFTDEELTALARSVCRRRFGIGADGLLAFAPPTEEGHDFRMRYLNADGSFATMCGNGARCLARFARHAGVDKDAMVFLTDAGVLRADVPADPTAPVRLYLVSPRDFTPDQPLAAEAARAAGSVHKIWTSTEHVVCFVDDLEATPVEQWGRAVRYDEALAPLGTNVNFVAVANGGGNGRPAVRARTYERGVEAETFACGTGAVASAMVSRLLGHVGEAPIDVHMPGGILTVGFRQQGEALDEVYLEGPAEVVYRGTFDYDLGG